MSELQDQLEAARARLHSGEATDEDRAEFKRLAHEVAEARRVERVKLEAERDKQVVAEGDAVATPATVAASVTGINERSS